MSDSKVPTAYVTKYSTTRGIVVVRDATRAPKPYAPGFLLIGANIVSPADWTDDRAIAEERWRKTVTKAHKAAQKKATTLGALLTGPAQYERETA